MAGDSVKFRQLINDEARRIDVVPAWRFLLNMPEAPDIQATAFRGSRASDLSLPEKLVNDLSGSDALLLQKQIKH